MNVLRVAGDISLNEGNGMAKGLFNVFNEQTNEVSNWFDSETKDELIGLNDSEFILEAERLLSI